MHVFVCLLERLRENGFNCRHETFTTDRQQSCQIAYRSRPLIWEQTGLKQVSAARMADALSPRHHQ